MCSLFVFFRCSDTNTLCPCITNAISNIHQFPPPAAPQEPMVAIPFQSLSLNRQSVCTALTPSVPPEWLNLTSPPLQAIFNQHNKFCEPYLSLKAIFEPTCQNLWSSPFITHQITCPSKPFLNQHAKRCEPVLSFLIRLPAPPSHFRTNMPSTVSQSRHSSSYYLPLQAIFEPTCQVLWASPIIFHYISCPSNPFLNRHVKRCEPFPSFLIILTSPPIHLWTNTTSAVSHSFHSSSDSSFIN